MVRKGDIPIYSPQWRGHLMGRVAVRVTARKSKSDLPMATVERKRSQKTSTESDKRQVVLRSLRHPGKRVWRLNSTSSREEPYHNVPPPHKPNVSLRHSKPRAKPKLKAQSQTQTQNPEPKPAQTGPELGISRRRTPARVNTRRRRQLPESTPKLTLAPVSHSPTRQLLHDQSTSSRGAAPPESPALAGPSGMALSAGLQEFDCHAPGLQCPGAQRRRLRPRQTGHLKRCCRFQRKRGQKRVKEVEVEEEENWLASDDTYCSREPCVVQ